MRANKFLSFALLSALLLLAGTEAQAAARWALDLGGPAWEALTSVRQTADSGFILAGYQPYHSLSAAWCVKLDPLGNVVWQRTYGGSVAYVPNSVCPTSDGGYIVAGSKHPALVYPWCLKLDQLGNVVWQKSYEALGVSSSASAIRQTVDGGYILAGHASPIGHHDPDMFLAKLDSSGNIIWQKLIGWAGDDYGSDVYQTSDAGYVAIGRAEASTFDVLVTRLDAAGNPLWMRTYGGIGADEGYSIQQTSDGGFVAAGKTDSWGSGGDAWCFKLDANGNMVWQRAYGGAGYDAATAIQQTGDGGYAMFGRTDQPGGGTNAWLIKLDSSGLVSWARTYGTGDWLYGAEDGQQTSEGGFAFCGRFTPGANHDGIVIRTALDGSIDASCGSLVQPSTPVVTTTSAAVVSQSGTYSSPLVAAIAAATPATPSSVSAILCSFGNASDWTGAWQNLRRKRLRVMGRFTVTNIGTISGGAGTVKIYLSNNQQAGRRAKLVKSFNIPNLSTDQSHTLNIRTSPSSKHKYLVAVIQNSSDIDVSNNTVAILLP